MIRIAFALVLLAGCVADTTVADADGGVAVAKEALGNCWDTPVVGARSGHPPYDVMTSVVAMKQWAGGLWAPCTCTVAVTDCTCPRLFGAGRATSHWNGLIAGHPLITTANYPDGSNNADRAQSIWPSDWYEYDFYLSAQTEEYIMGDHTGSITVTLQSAPGNVWLVHHCQDN